MTEETKEEKEVRLSIYREGVRARQNGIPITKNPYAPEFADHWKAGWFAGAKK